MNTQNLEKNIYKVLFYYRRSLKYIRNYNSFLSSNKLRLNHYIKNIVSETNFVTNKFPSLSAWHKLSVNYFCAYIFNYEQRYNILDKALFNADGRWSTVYFKLTRHTFTPTKVDWLFYFPIPYIEIIADAYEYYNNKGLEIITKINNSDEETKQIFCNRNNLSPYLLNAIIDVINKNLTYRLSELRKFIDSLKNGTFTIQEMRFNSLYDMISSHITKKQRKHIKAFMQAKIKPSNAISTTT